MIYSYDLSTFAKYSDKVGCDMYWKVCTKRTMRLNSGESWSMLGNKGWIANLALFRFHIENLSFLYKIHPQVCISTWKYFKNLFNTFMFSCLIMPFHRVSRGFVARKTPRSPPRQDHVNHTFITGKTLQDKIIKIDDDTYLDDTALVYVYRI